MKFPRKLNSLYSCLAHERNSELRFFVKQQSSFTRDRKLSLDHTIGHILHMAASRNMNGYDITSQCYFAQLRSQLNRDHDKSASRSSLCEARQKISWEAFKYLLEAINQDQKIRDCRFKWHGHTVRAIDGSVLTLPHADSVMTVFPRHNRGSITHYPYAQLIVATNVFTGQPSVVRMGPWGTNERDALLSMLSGFKPGDICLLDRGFEAFHVWRAFDEARVFYVARIKTGGKGRPLALQEFIESKKKSSVIELHQGEGKIWIRFIRWRKDPNGRPIVIGTNLLDPKYKTREIIQLYKKRWNIETMYYRVKCLMQVEKFHAKTLNGVLQEIWANLLILSLTALLVLKTIQASTRLKWKDRSPNFKNALEVVRRNVFVLLGLFSRKRTQRRLTQLLDEIQAVVCWHQNGRHNPRISKQPTNSWTSHRPLGKNSPRSDWQARDLKKRQERKVS